MLLKNEIIKTIKEKLNAWREGLNHGYLFHSYGFFLFAWRNTPFIIYVNTAEKCGAWNFSSGSVGRALTEDWDYVIFGVAMGNCFARTFAEQMDQDK